MPKLALQVGSQGFCLASEMRPLVSGQHTLVWEPVSSHHRGVYYSKAFKEPELISLLLIQP